MNDHRPLPLRHWQWKKQTGDAVIDEDDNPEAQEPPGRGHTSLPNVEENETNLTNPAKGTELTGDPPLTESERQKPPMTNAGGSTEDAGAPERRRE
jgi:hypothetical protein